MKQSILSQPWGFHCDDTHPNELCRWSSGCPPLWRSQPSDGPPASWCCSAQRMLGSWWSSGLLKYKILSACGRTLGWRSSQTNGLDILTMTKVSFGDFFFFTWVNKSLHRVPIDFAVDVEHNHLTKAFGGFLHGNGHVLFYIVLPGTCTSQTFGDKNEQASLSFDRAAFDSC